ncbi:TonB-dependent receptor plug domain-containing protein [Robiginitalea sediminis]|uniref:TonB-dependent receptor plug domain-containing protein n=1 Tax=Robiginitalea sediminis TaxID=1982593 RepID=UPI000B4B67FC|nr:TonB-dependent receptor [Robiginitalea sediminis]
MSLNKNKIALFFAGLFLLPLSGQELPRQVSDSFPTQDLEEVVISATRTYRQLSSLPLPVTLIPKAQIERTGVTRLNEIMAEQTGIVMTPDATIGGGEGVQIQGVASDYVLILIDGVPAVGRSSGNLDLSRFALGNVAQIEVVKGPSSSLFGSEALGGVINIITEEPDLERIRGSISHRAATFNNQNTSVNLGRKYGKTGVSFFADRLSTDGYDLAPADQQQTVNPFYNYTLGGRVRSEIGKTLDLLVSTRYFAQEFDVDPGTSEETDFNSLLRATHHVGERSEWQYELYYTRYTTTEETVDPIDETQRLDNDFDQRLLRPEIRFTYDFKGPFQLIAGAGYAFERLDRSLFDGQVSFNSQYLFSQLDFRPVPRLNLIAGARFDHHSVYASQLSPKFSARYDITDHLALKASVGSGFKAPDFRQLFLDFTNASGGGYSVLGKEAEVRGIQRLEDRGELASLAVARSELGIPLQAERSVGYNAGFRYRKGILTGEVNLFRNDFRNLIDTRILASKTNGQNVFGYLNRDRVYTQGAEVDLQLRPWPGLRLNAGYQYLLAFDKDKRDAVEQGRVFARDPGTLEAVRLEEGDYFGLENRSRHTLNFRAFGEVPRWDAFANLRVTYRSRFGLADLNGNDLLDITDGSFVRGYALVNLALGKTFLKRYQWQVGANNLLDFRGTNPLAAQDTEVFLNPGIQLFTRLSIQL